MVTVHRVLDPAPVTSLGAYQDLGGGRGLVAAREAGPEATLAVLDASGLRGRGGAGFPTGAKWRTIASYLTTAAPATIVVNAAEGEPGTFKDRALLRSNPYRVLEGALIAATTMGSDQVVVATKARFTEEVARLRRAADEIRMCGWADSIAIDIVEGPDEYLYGEETALLEALAGRPPFPRIAPPYRRGVDEVVRDHDEVSSDSGLSAGVGMATAADDNVVPPTLVDNVETLANVPKIVLRGSEWFRSVGTAESPGTIVCTITGRVRRPGVAELAMGTTLREAIAEVAGGPRDGHEVRAVLPGVSNGLVPADALDTPLTYEAMAAIGSGLGSAGYVVLDDADDLVSVAAGVSRFLAVESCGQCRPCKDDGKEIADRLEAIAASRADEHDLEVLLDRAATVVDGARCNLAHQQQAVTVSLTRIGSRDIAAHLEGAPPADRFVVAELVDIDEDGAAIDVGHVDKQPDWTYDETDSGQAPADRLAERRA